MQLALYAWTPPDVCAIPLRRKNGSIRSFAWVDADDFEKFGHHRWYMKADGYVKRSVYPNGQKPARSLFLHRAIMSLDFGDQRKVDHRNHNPRDCRKANLRVCTHAENHQNRRSTGDRETSSTYRGVSWSKASSRWQAYGVAAGKQHHLGFYDDEDEAGAVAAAFRRENMPYSKEAA